MTDPRKPAARSARTGGLADSVVDCTPQSLAAGEASGFVFEEATVRSFLRAVQRAVATWHQPQAWRRLQRIAMSRDFGWGSSARRYVALYQSMLRRSS